ncbi:MAG: ABC transporter ATP-binding protein [Candidatus Heimdallarchaeota archaeon]
MSHGHRGPMSAFRSEKHQNTRSTRQLIGMLWNYLEKFKITLLLSGALILAYTLGSIISPLIIQAGLDAVVNRTIFANPDFLASLFILFVGLSLGIWLVNSSNTYLLARVRANMLHDVRKDIFENLVSADMSFHKKEQSGNVTSRVTSDTDELAAGITVFSNMSSQILLGLGTFIILLVTSWLIAGIALLAIPIAIVLAFVLGRLGRKIMYGVRRSYGAVSGQMAESLAGVSIAKAFNREEWSSTVLSDLNEKTYQYFKQMGALFNFMFPAVSMISTILVAMTLVVGGYLSTTVLSLGSIYLGTIMVQRFLSPLLHIAMFYPQIQASLAAMDRVADVLEQEPQVIDKVNAVSLDTTDTRVTFDNVSYEYVEDIPVLQNVSFKVEKGEKLAIVGHTGAGKTTLAALVTRFFDPIEGRILIGDQDLRDVTQASLHSNIGLIGQEPYLFADTVIENIRYSNRDISDGEIIELCKLIGADDFIEALPDGYHTVLQESGKGLSSGQRQMITIARMMLADPKILVLDEATSRLDAYSESLVQLAQQALFKGRTTFVIAHRLTTIRDVDRIAVFEKGKLVELGTHKELLSQSGVYAELYDTYYKHQGVEEIGEGLEARTEAEIPTLPPYLLAMAKSHGIDPESMLARMKERGMDPEKMKEMMREGGSH